MEGDGGIRCGVLRETGTSGVGCGGRRGGASGVEHKDIELCAMGCDP